MSSIQELLLVRELLPRVPGLEEPSGSGFVRGIFCRGSCDNVAERVAVHLVHVLIFGLELVVVLHDAKRIDPNVSYPEASSDKDGIAKYQSQLIQRESLLKTLNVPCFELTPSVAQSHVLIIDLSLVGGFDEMEAAVVQVSTSISRFGGL